MKSPKTSDTEGHPKSSSHAYKVNGIGSQTEGDQVLRRMQ